MKILQNWYTVTNLQLAVTRAELAHDRTAVRVLSEVLAEETHTRRASDKKRRRKVSRVTESGTYVPPP